MKSSSEGKSIHGPSIFWIRVDFDCGSAYPYRSALQVASHERNVLTLGFAICSNAFLGELLHQFQKAVLVGMPLRPIIGYKLDTHNPHGT